MLEFSTDSAQHWLSPQRAISTAVRSWNRSGRSTTPLGRIGIRSNAPAGNFLQKNAPLFRVARLKSYSCVRNSYAQDQHDQPSLSQWSVSKNDEYQNKIKQLRHAKICI